MKATLVLIKSFGGMENEIALLGYGSVGRYSQRVL